MKALFYAFGKRERERDLQCIFIDSRIKKFDNPSKKGQKSDKVKEEFNTNESRKRKVGSRKIYFSFRYEKYNDIRNGD